MRRNGKVVALGRFSTAEEAALCVARSPEGQAAAEQAASAGGISKASLPAMLSGVVMKEDAQEDGVILPMPPGAFVEKEMVSPMPSDPFVKQEVVVKEEEGPGRSKRQRTTRRRIHAVQGIHTFFRVVELPRRESRRWDFSFLISSLYYRTLDVPLQTAPPPVCMAVGTAELLLM